MSTTKAEYIALGHVTREAVWIKRFINKIKFKAVKGIILYGDNEMSIALMKNIESQYCIKHIDVQHHYIRELTSEEKLTVKWIPRSEMLINGMTKELPIKTFKKYQT